MLVAISILVNAESTVENGRAQGPLARTLSDRHQLSDVIMPGEQIYGDGVKR